MSEPIRLTQYSHGAGCGCKISPKVLETILAGSGAQNLDPKLWVGNASRDDAAVYALDDERGVVSTTDFFMPIVDDPYDFGRIAATNAISDIYAMGADPLMAIAILGWPINVLAPEVAREVMRGGRAVCDAAGIPLAGGHSIDAPEPIFGLAVTGVVEKRHMKRNDTATRRLPAVPDQTAGHRHFHHSGEEIQTARRGCRRGPRLDVHAEHRRQPLRQTGRRAGDDRRHRLRPARPSGGNGRRQRPDRARRVSPACRA